MFFQHQIGSLNDKKHFSLKCWWCSKPNENQFSNSGNNFEMKYCSIFGFVSMVFNQTSKSNLGSHNKLVFPHLNMFHRSTLMLVLSAISAMKCDDSVQNILSIFVSHRTWIYLFPIFATCEIFLSLFLLFFYAFLR